MQFVNKWIKGVIKFELPSALSRHRCKLPDLSSLNSAPNQQEQAAEKPYLVKMKSIQDELCL